jgi:hypothetical protein
VPIDIPKRQADRLRVLSAIFDAAGGIEGEMVRIVPTVQAQLALSDRDLQAACAYLAGQGLIDTVSPIDQSSMVLFAKLTHRGVMAIEEPEKPPKAIALHERETTMTDIEKKQADRLLVMKAIYEASGGSEHSSVSGRDLLNDLGLSDEELANACKYLEGEHLIKSTRTMWGHLTPYIVDITHRGIKEMEQSLQAPTKPTEHFPPYVSIVHVEGDVIGSPIQSGSPGASQEVSSEVNLGEVRDFLRKLEEDAPSLNLPDPESRELTAEIATLKAQVDSPRPKRQIIRESLRSIRTILEGAAGNLSAAGLLELLQHIHP